jgi:hypothetical protein
METSIEKITNKFKERDFKNSHAVPNLWIERNTEAIHRMLKPNTRKAKEEKNNNKFRHKLRK